MKLELLIKQMSKNYTRLFFENLNSVFQYFTKELSLNEVFMGNIEEKPLIYVRIKMKSIKFKLERF